MSSTPVRVLLVDDHPVMRDGLQQLLERTGEFEVVGHAGDGEEAERAAGLPRTGSYLERWPGGLWATSGSLIFPAWGRWSEC